MGSDVTNVAEYKTNEHEEEADQREGCGRTDHLWEKTRKTDSLFGAELGTWASTEFDLRCADYTAVTNFS